MRTKQRCPLPALASRESQLRLNWKDSVVMKDKKVPHRSESLGRESAHPQQREMDPVYSTGGG